MKKLIVCCVAVCCAGLFIKADLFAKGKTKIKAQQEAFKAKKSRKSNRAADILKSAKSKHFDVYTDKGSRSNHYIPSGYMGDYGDVRVSENHKKNPHKGTTCIKIAYNNKASQGAAWSGLFWQNPANNWGTRPGGYDLTGAKKFVFWVRGEQGGELISEFKIGGISGEYADTDSAVIYDVELTTKWQKYVIDLSDLDLSSISGGFCWAANLDANPDGVTFYLDDIYYDFK